MRCHTLPCTFHFGVDLLTLALAPALGAQTRDPQPTATPSAPSIVWAEPMLDTPMPAEAALLVVRYAASEADPVDPRTIRLLIDGVDATSALRIGAWGAWAFPGRPEVGTGAQRSSTSDPDFAPGDHHLAFRVCTRSGVCTDAERQLSVTSTAGSVADTAVPAEAPLATRSILDRLIELLMDLVRRFVSGGA